LVFDKLRYRQIVASRDLAIDMAAELPGKLDERLLGRIFVFTPDRTG
jgi:hypothetical protein